MKKSKIQSHLTSAAAVRRRPATVRRLLVEALCERRVLATITGMVFSDANDDWRASSHEVTLADRLVFVDHNDNGLPDDGEPFALTDLDGRFSLEQLGSDAQIVRLFSGRPSQQQQFPIHPDWNPSNIVLANLELLAASGNLRLDPFSSRAVIPVVQGLKIADLSARTAIDVPLDADPIDVAFLGDGSLIVLASDAHGHSAYRVAADGLVQPLDLTVNAEHEADTEGSGPVNWSALAVDGDGHGVLIPDGDSDSVVVHQLFASSGGITSWGTTTTVTPGTQVVTGGAVTTVIAEPIVGGLGLSLWSNSTGTIISSERVPVMGAEKLLAYSDASGLAFVLLSEDSEDDSRAIAVLDAAADFAPLQTIAGLEEIIAVDTGRAMVFSLAPESSRLRAIDALTAEIVADWMLEFDLSSEPLELALDAAADELVLLGSAGLATVSLDRVDAHRLQLDGATPPFPLRFAARVTGENHPPFFLEALEYDGLQGQTLVLPDGALLTRASDPDGDPLIVVRTSSPLHGTATVTPTGGLTYTPDADFVGIDSFTVLLHDGHGSSTETTVRILIAPEVIQEPELTITIQPVPENVEPGFVVGQIDVFGFGGRPVRFHIADPRFEVVDGWILVAPGAQLNYEDEYFITTSVTATDLETEQSVTRTFSVQVTDEDDPIEDIQPRSASVHENVAGELIAELMVIDEDSEQPFIFTVDDDRFEIHHRNLRLKPGVSLNYEAGAQIVINITATDAWGGGNSLTVPFTIEVLDVAEAASSISLTNNTVMEWVSGAEVGEILVDGFSLGSSYVAAVDDSRFEIVDGRLKLRKDEFLTFSTQQEAQLIISVRDTGQVFPPVAETFVVIVLENENPFHNSSSPFDVNNDGMVTPLDALLILNALSKNGGGGPISTFSPPGRYWDVNGDGLITPLDALLILNFINHQNRNPGLSEPEAQVEAAQRQVSTQPQQRVGSSSENIASTVFSASLKDEWHVDSIATVAAAPPIESLPNAGQRTSWHSPLAPLADRALEILDRRSLRAEWIAAARAMQPRLQEIEQILRGELTSDQQAQVEQWLGKDPSYELTAHWVARVNTFLDRLDRA